MQGAPPPPPPCGTSGTPCSTAMTFGVRTVGKLRVAKPLRLVVTCSAACTYKLTVVLSAKTAKRFGLGRRSVTIGTVRGALLAAGKKNTKLTLSAKARRRLKRAKTVPAKLRLAVTDAAGKALVKSKSITLRR